MLQDEFERIVDETLKRCKETLCTKAYEYATQDRLYNFKQPTSLLGANQAQVCLYYQTKHLASIHKIARDLNEGIIPSDELLDEKVNDMINYCLLFKANVIDFRRQKEFQESAAYTSAVLSGKYDIIEKAD